jgi:uncharacterized protein YkwD
MFRRSRHFASLAVAAVALLAPALGPSDAAATATACAGAGASPSRAGDAHVLRATLCLLNGVRRRHGLDALRLNAQLSRAARGHSSDMVRRRYFAHYTPEGLSPAHRVAATGYLRGHRHWLVGETLAWWRFHAAPAAVVHGWMHSPPHRKVLLEPAFRDVGIGVVLGVPTAGGRGGATYTADFGARH